MEICYEFKYDPYKNGRIFYTCFIRNQLVPESSNYKFNGKYHSRHSNNDVIDMIFNECNITKVPQGLTIFSKYERFDRFEFKLIKNHQT